MYSWLELKTGAGSCKSVTNLFVALDCMNVMAPRALLCTNIHIYIYLYIYIYIYNTTWFSSGLNHIVLMQLITHPETILCRHI